MVGGLSSANAGDPAAARRRAPPPPARPPPSSHPHAWPAAGSATNGSDQPGPRVNLACNGQPGVLLLKRPLTSFILHVGPPTLKDSYSLVLNFMFEPLALIDFHTRGPEHPFYDLNLLFLSRISF
jgi:hypothetical protein